MRLKELFGTLLNALPFFFWSFVLKTQRYPDQGSVVFLDESLVARKVHDEEEALKKGIHTKK